ncbi:hypothetical protein ABT364_18725 [Massilia sp. SR12]
MSWDITVQRFGKEYAHIAEIPEDEQCSVLGSSAEVRAAISRFFPAVDWTDSAWGVFESDYGSVEFNMGSDEQNSGFMMHVRASSQVIPLIVAMCLSERWQALDCSEGVFLEKAMAPAVGLESWTVYRDQVISDV